MDSNGNEVDEEKTHNRTIQFNQNFGLDVGEPDDKTDKDGGSNIEYFFKANSFGLFPLKYAKKSFSSSHISYLATSRN